jgi:hypothetical protein
MFDQAFTAALTREKREHRNRLHIVHTLASLDPMRSKPLPDFEEMFPPEPRAVTGEEMTEDEIYRVMGQWAFVVGVTNSPEPPPSNP